MSTPTEHEIAAADSTPLLVRDWSSEQPQSPRGLLLIVHGVGEHSGRYQHFADTLAPAGYALRGFDHRGHGLSGGLRGHVDGFSNYTADVKAVLDEFRSAHAEDLPCYLLGHSMGGLIALQFLQDYPTAGVRGAILSNPCLEVAVNPPAVKVVAGKLLSRVLPQLRLDNELNTSLLCRDADAVRTYEQDPLVHRKISTRWYTSLLAAMDLVKSRGLAPKLPTLWLLGNKDSICSAAGSRNFAAKLESSATTVREWPDALHEVHNGPDKNEYLAALNSWLDTQTSGASEPS
jgi:alpha-beta hydrolase superfamily lysophospholipase